MRRHRDPRSFSVIFDPDDQLDTITTRRSCWRHFRPTRSGCVRRGPDVVREARQAALERPDDAPPREPVLDVIYEEGS
jgi:hypothetical protein